MGGSRWGLDRSWAARALAAGALFLAACRPGPSPPQEGLLPVRGTELYVRRMGQGEPVLVVHGGPMLEHGYLLPWLEPLAQDHELVFFDQRLSGRSAGTVDSASVRLDTLVADMEAIRDALGLERIHILGHSWGGLLALRYGILHPDRVSSMVLVSPMAASAGLWRSEEEALQQRVTPAYLAETERLRTAPGLPQGDTAAIAALLRHSFSLQLHDPERASELALFIPEDYLSRSRQFAFLARDLEAFDFHAELARVQAPVLLLFGADEPGADLGGAALARALPEATLVRIPDAGHFAFLEEPEAFLGEVRAFLGRR